MKPIAIVESLNKYSHRHRQHSTVLVHEKKHKILHTKCNRMRAQFTMTLQLNAQAQRVVVGVETADQKAEQ